MMGRAVMAKKMRVETPEEHIIRACRQEDIVD
jgi:hypothetical protein